MKALFEMVQHREKYVLMYRADPPRIMKYKWGKRTVENMITFISMTKLTT